MRSTTTHRQQKRGVTAESLAEITRKIMADSNSYYVDTLNCRIYQVHEHYLAAVLDICSMSLSQHLKRICRKGALALNAKLTPEQRGASARHAAQIRWAKEKESKLKKDLTSRERKLYAV